MNIADEYRKREAEHQKERYEYLRQKYKTVGELRTAAMYRLEQKAAELSEAEAALKRAQRNHDKEQATFHALVDEEGRLFEEVSHLLEIVADQQQTKAPQ